VIRFALTTGWYPALQCTEERNAWSTHPQHQVMAKRTNGGREAVPAVAIQHIQSGFTQQHIESGYTKVALSVGRSSGTVVVVRLYKKEGITYSS
jgi:hypothetical protein